MNDGAALHELPHLVFTDDAGNDRRRGRSAEQKAAAFWIDHHGPRSRSPSDPAMFMLQDPGIVHPTHDAEWTVELVERAASDAIRDPAWRLCTLVALAWGLGLAGLRNPAPDDGGPPFLERAGGPAATLPPSLSRRRLEAHTRAFRDRLLELRVIAVRREALELEREAPPAPAPSVTLIGWKAIAAFFRVSEDTAQRWANGFGLPVNRASGRQPIAVLDELLAWAKTRPAL